MVIRTKMKATLPEYQEVGDLFEEMTRQGPRAELLVGGRLAQFVAKELPRFSAWWDEVPPRERKK